MTPEQLAELFVEDTGDNITGIATDIEILLKQAYKSGYKCAVDKVAEYLLSALEHELGYFATGDFVKGVMKFMEEL